MEKYHTGIDLGKNSLSVCVIDGNQKIIKEFSVITEAEEVIKEFNNLPECHCIVEAGPLAEWLCAVVESINRHTITIIDPRQAKAVTHSKKKTDKRDARTLARLALAGMYVPVHRKSGAARAMRSYAKGRQQILKIAQQAGSTIRGIMLSHGLKMTSSGGTSEFMKEVEKLLKKVPEIVRAVIEPLLNICAQARSDEKRLYKSIPKVSSELPVVKILQTVDGVGPATAAVYAATIDSPQRFSSASKVSSYLGLVPSVYQSGETEYRGRITKHGDHLLRWLLIEAATTLLTRTKKASRLKEWGLKIQAAKGMGKARVAVARKLAELMYHAWIKNQEFERFPELKKAAA